MSNPFFNMFGQNQQLNPMNNMMNNMMDIMNRFNQFRNSFNGTPQQAQQQVQQMLNSGQVSQSQFNQCVNMANQIMQMLGRR